MEGKVKLDQAKNSYFAQFVLLIECLQGTAYFSLNEKLIQMSATDIHSAIRFQLSYFSTISYVVTICWNRLVETIPTNGLNIGFS